MISLSGQLFPWSRSLYDKSEDIQQWAFAFFSVLLLLLCFVFWGKVSRFRGDPHVFQCANIVSGLTTIVLLAKQKQCTYNCVEQWIENSIGDYGNRRRRTTKHILCRVAYCFLLFPAGLVLALPSLLYILAVNVSSNALAVFSNNVFITVLKIAINGILLRPITFHLVRMRRAYLVHDEMAFNGLFVQTSWLLLILVDAFYPVLMQIILDE